MRFHSIGPVSFDSLVEAVRNSEYSVLTVHAETDNVFTEYADTLTMLSRKQKSRDEQVTKPTGRK